MPAGELVTEPLPTTLTRQRRWIGVNVAVTTAPHPSSPCTRPCPCSRPTSPRTPSPTPASATASRRCRRRSPALQSRPQSMPAGALVTEPLPTTFVVSVRWIGVNVAVTERAGPSSPSTRPCPCSHQTSPRTPNRAPASAKASPRCRRRSPASNQDRSRCRPASSSPSHCRRRSPISVRWIGVNVAVTDRA